MPEPCLVSVYERQTLLYSAEFAEPVELGRQARDEPLLQPRWDRDRWRLAIARPEEQTLSRKYVLVEQLAGRRVKITNQSSALPIGVSDGFEVLPGATWEAPLPLQLNLGERTVHLSLVLAEDAPLQCLSQPPWMPEGDSAHGSVLFSGLNVTAGMRLSSETLVRWLQTALEVLQSAATSSDFFAKAARAARELAGLDSSGVLLWDGSGWRGEAVDSASRPGNESLWRPSREILRRVREEKRTFWRGAGGDPLAAASLRGVRAVVAAPILDRNGEVIAVLYGDSWGGGAPMTRVEASLVELLAGVVAAGLARLEQERTALALQVRYEQFLPPELVRLAVEQPELLEQGRDAEVTLLFADVRGFSRVSERLGPERTFAWVRAIMDALSDCVLAHRGVIVNYVGDEIVAMWGAPEARPDHAELACRAALAMLDALGPLNEGWQGELGEPTALGIGLNTGPARVGRTGSQRRFTYGPLGNAVNVASRVQGATRHLNVAALVTGATRQRLGAEFATRRLCRAARVVHIAEPVELYELVPPGRAGFEVLQRGYEAALARYEGGAFRAAVGALGRLLQQHPDDTPALLLMSRAVAALAQKPVAFDPVWDLPGK